jgi:hypothetical protein
MLDHALSVAFELFLRLLTRPGRTTSTPTPLAWGPTACFQPFQRLAANRLADKGVGSGMSIVAAIAAAHGADLSTRPLPGGGLQVQARFPRLLTSSDPTSETVT